MKNETKVTKRKHMAQEYDHAKVVEFVKKATTISKYRLTRRITSSTK